MKASSGPFAAAFVIAGMLTAAAACAPDATTVDSTRGDVVGATPRSGETATGTASSGTPVGGTAFDQTLELQGITFHVTCANDSSAPTLTIVPAGLEIDNSPIVRQVDGHVVLAEVTDLNVDGSPEIYVYAQSVGSRSYASLVAYAANNKKSLSEIYLPPFTDDANAARGFRGGDEFAVVETTLVRRFRVYRDGDTDGNPTGGWRQFQYKLAAGEAGWILRTDKVVEY